VRVNASVAHQSPALRASTAILGRIFEIDFDGLCRITATSDFRRHLSIVHAADCGVKAKSALRANGRF